MGGDTVTTTLSTVWTEVSYAITQLTNNPTTALMITIPVTGMVIALAKGIFKRRSRG